MKFSFNTQHWILIEFKSKQNNKPFVVINVYMLVNPVEKSSCWRSISNLKDKEFFMDCIVVGDFNVIRNSAKKRRAIFGRDSFREKMEALIEEWDMIDVIP
jgi:disulfide oxidoreductase YuzD